jgi:hypothetical protein
MIDLNKVPNPPRRPINFAKVNGAAIAVLPSLVNRWLPGGRIEGNEYVVRNPRRADRRVGSFKVNLRTGRWSDFAVKDAAGGDPVSLAAYLAGISQIEAAERVAQMLGVEARDV